MQRRTIRAGKRGGALVTLAAFLFVLLGAMPGLAADREAAGESCAGCPACEAGDCRNEAGHPLESHHHCCTTSCLSHASVTLAAEPIATAPEIVAPLASSGSLVVCGRSQDTPYRPPRS
jgi:hypothetical protein